MDRCSTLDYERQNKILYEEGKTNLRWYSNVKLSNASSYFSFITTPPKGPQCPQRWHIGLRKEFNDRLAQKWTFERTKLEVHSASYKEESL